MRDLALLLWAFAVSPSMVTSQEVEPTQSTPRAALVDDVPDGTNWGANAKTGLYNRVGCPITMGIPLTDRLYYQDETSLQDLTPAAADNPIRMPQARQSVDGKRSRKGFWFNGGLGYGRFGYRGGDGRVGDLSGGLALGGSLSQKVSLGVGTNVWRLTENGGNLTAGTLAALLRFYPSATGGIFLLGGLGVGAIHGKREGLEGETQAGYGALAGLGYDILVGNSVSLTPFLNWFAANTPETDFSVWQIGLGVTVH
jgi:hypothetical protein